MEYKPDKKNRLCGYVKPITPCFNIWTLEKRHYI